MEKSWPVLPLRAMSECSSQALCQDPWLILPPKAMGTSLDRLPPRTVLMSMGCAELAPPLTAAALWKAGPAPQLGCSVELALVVWVG